MERANSLLFHIPRSGDQSPVLSMDRISARQAAKEKDQPVEQGHAGL
jgi:hypothetical protein